MRVITTKDDIEKMEDDFIASLTEDEMRKALKQVFKMQGRSYQRWLSAEHGHYLKDYFHGMETGLMDALRVFGFK